MRLHTRRWPLSPIRALADDLRTYYRQEIRVLNVVGIRAGESRRRAKMEPFGRDERASSKRTVIDRWYPIFDWSVGDVWQAVWASGLPWHEAYDWGLPRLSCTVCVLATESAHRTGALLRPGLARQYADVERAIGRTLQPKFAIEPLIDEIEKLGTPADLVAYARTYGAESIRTWEG